MLPRLDAIEEQVEMDRAFLTLSHPGTLGR
jgi:hypothetical protein